MRQVVFRGGPEENDSQEGQRKRLRGRPPTFAVVQERAAADPRQGKLNLVAMGSGSVAGASGAPSKAPEPATARLTARSNDLDMGIQGV